MALRLEEESIVSAEFCNGQKDRVKVEINFVDGSTMRAELRGNPHRDLAGRTLKLRHDDPDTRAVRPPTLDLAQTGVAGDLTAAKKVRVPVIPADEVSAHRAAKEEIPTTWKNSVYLEWYSPQNGRVVLEGSELAMSVSEAEWEMTAADEKAAGEASVQALHKYLDQLCVIDRKKEAREAEESEDEPMDEFAWEKFLRHSDSLSDRYSELIDKFGFEDEKTIAHYMKWDHEIEAEAESGDSGWRDEIDYGFDGTGDFDDSEPLERRHHPLHGQARALLESVDYPQEESDSPLARLWSAVATLSAKLAGALSSYDCDRDPDAGFTIAQLKRCLAHIDTAVGEARDASPPHVQPLLRMRQTVIDLQNELRSSM